MYNSQVTATQLEILNPVMNAEVLVLDDLGAIRPSDWVWDTVSLMINNRYNGMRTTIITTNYPVLASGEGGLRAERSVTASENVCAPASLRCARCRDARPGLPPASGTQTIKLARLTEKGREVTPARGGIPLRFSGS